MGLGYQAVLPAGLPSWLTGLWNSMMSFGSLLQTITGHTVDFSVLVAVEEKALLEWAGTILPSVLANPASIPTLLPQALAVATGAFWANLASIFPTTPPPASQLHALFAMFKMNPMTSEGIS